MQARLRRTGGHKAHPLQFLYFFEERVVGDVVAVRTNVSYSLNMPLLADPYNKSRKDLYYSLFIIHYSLNCIRVFLTGQGVIELFKEYSLPITPLQHLQLILVLYLYLILYSFQSLGTQGSTFKYPFSIFNPNIYSKPAL